MNGNSEMNPLRVTSILALCLISLGGNLKAANQNAELNETGRMTVVQAPELYTWVGAYPIYATPTEAGTLLDVSYQGRQHKFRFFDGGTGSARRPAILLLHGANRDGRSMIDTWKAVATQFGFVIVAPDSYGDSWQPVIDRPVIFDAIMKRVVQDVPIDPERVFLFGHSSGAVYAQFLANRALGGWAAVSTHGGAMEAASVLNAQRRLPVQIILGTDDDLFPLASAHKTARNLAKAGHTIEFVEIPNHTHWYYDAAPKINAAAAKFFFKQVK